MIRRILRNPRKLASLIGTITNRMLRHIPSLDPEEARGYAGVGLAMAAKQYRHKFMRGAQDMVARTCDYLIRYGVCRAFDAARADGMIGRRYGEHLTPARSVEATGGDSSFQPARGPRPDEVATAKDLMDQIMSRLDNTRDRRIFKAIVRGESPSKIAKAEHVTTGAIYQHRDSIRLVTRGILRGMASVSDAMCEWSNP